MDLSGTLTAATVDLNAGNIDGVAIGDAVTVHCEVYQTLQLVAYE